MEKGKRVDTPRKMGKVYKNKQHKTGFPRAVLQSSPTRGMWIEIGVVASVGAFLRMSSPTRGMWIEITTVAAPPAAPLVIPHTGDVD